jgi:hypothetical protein
VIVSLGSTRLAINVAGRQSLTAHVKSFVTLMKEDSDHAELMDNTVIVVNIQDEHITEKGKYIIVMV